MCDRCGCGAHDHGHGHGHDHGHAGEHRTLQVERAILAHNNAHAAENRLWLTQRGVVAINLISSPCTGKTRLLEQTLTALSGTIGCAVIAGDQETDRDAQRLRGHGAPVVQIETGSACHLDAARVGDVLREVVRPDTRLLFIENVGNLVCRAAFDLGETIKVALLSVTEGEDKPLKYPALFLNASAAVITKTDLIPHLEWDREACLAALRTVRPGLRILPLSARTGEGMEAWLEFLKGLAGQ